MRYEFYVIGYIAAAAEPKPKDRSSIFRGIRIVLFYGILLLVTLNVISALSGGGMYKIYNISQDHSISLIFADTGGLTGAFSTSSKYEVHPEDVRVDFSDVRGVIFKKVMYCFV